MEQKSQEQFSGAYEFIYRRILYPLFEGVVRRRHTLRYLHEYERNQWRSHDELQALQWSKIVRLLQFCHEQVPYYRQRWTAAGIHWRDIKTPADFAALPLLTKDDIRRNYEQLIAEPFKGRTLRKATGGSTGQPLTFEYSQESNERRMAVMMRGYAWAGARPGQRTVFVWSGDVGEVPLAKRIKISLHHRVLRRRMLNCFYLKASNLDEYLKAIDAYRPVALVGYTSSLHQLALRLLESPRPHWRPQTIVTGAEALLEYQRQDIERAFGCRVFNTYGCREFMLIAAECPEHNGLHVNMDHLAVELIDTGGRLASSGQVVITDLHNYGMPFVRYANGDLATSTSAGCACGRHLPRLQSLDGRLLDLIRTQDGRMVSGVFFPHLLKEIPGIERFQVIQKDLETINIKIVKGAGFQPGKMPFLEGEIRKVLGDRVNVRYDFVSDIPLTPSGKQRVTISELDGFAG